MFALALSGLSVGQMAIAIVVIAGIVAIVLIVLKNSGVAVPAWAISIFWVLVLCCVAVLAIRFLMSL